MLFYSSNPLVMRALIHILPLLVVGTLFVSCEAGRPISTTPPQNNKTYRVEYLFEHDGCKVYRFYDRGNYVYFTNCRGEATSIQNDSTRTQTSSMIRRNPKE